VPSLVIYLHLLKQPLKLYYAAGVTAMVFIGLAIAFAVAALVMEARRDVTR
jgi:hypothetical protein